MVSIVRQAIIAFETALQSFYLDFEVSEQLVEANFHSRGWYESGFWHFESDLYFFNGSIQNSDESGLHIIDNMLLSYAF